MRLHSTDGVTFTLRPLRYEFPELAPTEPDDWDANWLVLRGELHVPGHVPWSFEDPSLTTWDAAHLTRWLRRVASGQAAPGRHATLEFVEPDLAFSLAAVEAGLVTVRVHLALEARPPWSPAPDDDVLDPYAVDVTTTCAGLARAVEEWEREVAAFPVR
ncbi:hypothetical protein GXB85_16705 [Cellulomonas sp. APG4]|uniref:WapI family immunity protein n=1 Tax=Cellulomonas sp. APG4 TaxID=1538656 RepID=UPI00137B4D80|nr:hypothetical protein [Cellulomonas sp. APG4]NCT92576.1 hypothetical protein [Cellulomonas sp. APG4]